MELTVASTSDDDVYALAESEAMPVVVAAPAAVTTASTAAPTPSAATPAPEPAAPAAPAGAPTAKRGLLGRFGRKPAPAEANGKAAGKDGASEATLSAKEAAQKDPNAPKAPSLRRKKKAGSSLRFEAPAWLVSVVIHAAIISALAVAGLTPEARKVIKSLNASMVDTSISKQQAEELVHVYADPSNAPRDQATAEITSGASAGGGGVGLGTGTGPASATPRVGVSTNVGERTSLPGAGAGGIPKLSGLSMLGGGGSFIARDLSAAGGGSGMIAGDVTYETKDVGQALDQLAREILRHLQRHKLTVVWLFDESGSMKDDQQAIRDKFSRVSSELKVNTDDDKKTAGALQHVVVGFGDGLHVEQGKPTGDIDAIGNAIKKLKVDETGTENTMQALTAVVNQYSKQISKDRRLLVVLVTDESGDDGSYVEEARQALVSRGIPLYVIGRQSLFGYDRAHLLYIDPLTKDHYWPAIRRGPETAGVEVLHFDGLHERWDEQPSGFAPYELARLAKDSSGIYFLLPSEENMRVRQREKAYSIQVLKEYVPDYESRQAYLARREKSELRRTMSSIIEETKGYPYRRHYPIDLAPLGEAIQAELPIVEQRLSNLITIEKRLRSLEKSRDREPEKRWQANYDLMLAQIVVSQIKAYEYRACLIEMVKLGQKGQLKPSKMPIPNELTVEWVIDHSQDRKAPKAETEKKYAEAKRLLDLVISRHPKTPWADLAQDEFARGFGCQRNEWHHSPRYDERAKLVPKY